MSNLNLEITSVSDRAVCPLCTAPTDRTLAGNISRPDNRICPSCGLVFQPRRDSSIEDLASCYAGDGYWNAETVKLSRFTRISVLDDVRRGRARLHGIEQISGRRISAHDTVLDIGCGYGGLLWQIKKKRDARVSGLEPSPVCTQAARSLLGLDVRQGMFEESECRQDGGYTLITSLHTLEHVADPVAFLRRAGELLSPDGLLYIEVPNLLHPSAGFPLLRFFEEAHLTNFSATTLEAAADLAGLETVAQDTRGFLRFVLKRAGQALTPVYDAAHAEEVLLFLTSYHHGEQRTTRKLRTFTTRAGYAFRLACYPLLHPIQTMRILCRRT